MMSTRINAGCGTVKFLSIRVDGKIVSIESMWQSVIDFGMSRDVLEKLQMTYKELSESCYAISIYMISAKYLKELKVKI